KSYEFPMTPAFNEPPFSLGNYENIATYKGGKYGRADFFKIGFKDNDRLHGEFEAIGTYINDKGTPLLINLAIKSDSASCELKRVDDQVVISGSFRVSSTEEATQLNVQLPMASIPGLPARSWLGAIFRYEPKKKLSQKETQAFEEL